jgi:hypothetical protein
MNANAVEQTARNLRTACISRICARLSGYYLSVRQPLKSFYPLAKWRIPVTRHRHATGQLVRSISLQASRAISPAPAPPSNASSVPTFRKGQSPPRLTRGGVLYGRDQNLVDRLLEGHCWSRKRGDYRTTSMSTPRAMPTSWRGRFDYLHAMYLINNGALDGIPIA